MLTDIGTDGKQTQKREFWSKRRRLSSYTADVQCGASESSLDSSLVLSAAQSLTGESSQLTAGVSRYLKSVRAT
jgi:hypothetical protein